MVDRTVRRCRLRAWLLFAVSTLAALAMGTAQAHNLKLFALVDAGEISGSVYFAGGSRVPGARIVIQDAAGAVLAETSTDVEGRFRFRPTRAVDHVIVADSGDGHLAYWTVPGYEIDGIATLPAMAQQAELLTPPGQPDAQLTPAALDDLLGRVEQAVASQVVPLREELASYEQRLRLQDLLGGLGYILGLAGMALWWYGRARR